MLYVPCPPLFEYLAGIQNTYSDDAGRVLMIPRTENLLILLACFFANFGDGYYSHSYRFAQFDFHRGGFIVSLQMGSYTDLEIVG